MHVHTDPTLDRDHAADPYDQLLRAGLCRRCGRPTREPRDETPAPPDHPFRPVDADRSTCGACLAPSGDHRGPFDDTANHGTAHDGLRSPELDGWACHICLSERDADRIVGMPTTPELDAMAELPLDDEAVDELAAALGVPDGAAWSTLLRLADADRRARAERYRPILADIAGDACYGGIVPCHRYCAGRDHGIGHQRRAGTIAGAWRHTADVARQNRAAGALVATATWRGEPAAHRDAGDERYNLAATGGRWYHVMPPIYAAGDALGLFETTDDAYAPISD